MVTGLTFIIFMFLGMGVFSYGIKLYGRHYGVLYRKVTTLKKEVSNNEEILKQKLVMEKAISEMKREANVLEVRVQQKQEKLDELEQNVASLKDQGTKAEVRAEIEQLNLQRDSINKEYVKAKQSIVEMEDTYRQLNDVYEREKAIRESQLKTEMDRARQRISGEIDDDVAKYKEMKLTETKTTVDKAKITAVRTVKDWWNAEKKKLEGVLSSEYQKMKDQYQERLEAESAKEIKEVAKEISKIKEQYESSLK